MRARRLERGAELFRRYDLPIAVVAERSGFRDPAYFARVFSRRYGCSPSVWREGAE